MSEPRALRHGGRGESGLSVSGSGVVQSEPSSQSSSGEVEMQEKKSRDLSTENEHTILSIHLPHRQRWHTYCFAQWIVRLLATRECHPSQFVPLANTVMELDTVIPEVTMKLVHNCTFYHHCKSYALEGNSPPRGSVDRALDSGSENPGSSHPRARHRHSR